MKRRSAISLIELQVAMTVGAALSLLAVVLITRMIAGESAVRQRLLERTSAQRAIAQFRSDVHAGRAVAQPNPDAPLTITLADTRQVVYSIVDGHLRRALVDHEKTVQQETLAVRGKDLAVLPSESSTGRQVRLALWLPGQHKDTNRGALEVVAVLAVDHRYAK